MKEAKQTVTLAGMYLGTATHQLQVNGRLGLWYLESLARRDISTSYDPDRTHVTQANGPWPGYLMSLVWKGRKQTDRIMYGMN